jgi:hypothetical protein
MTRLRWLIQSIGSFNLCSWLGTRIIPFYFSKPGGRESKCGSKGNPGTIERLTGGRNEGEKKSQTMDQNEQSTTSNSGRFLQPQRTGIYNERRRAELRDFVEACIKRFIDAGLIKEGPRPLRQALALHQASKFFGLERPQ